MGDPSSNIEQIARRLSQTMRDGLLRKPCPSWWGTAPAAMPHSKATARALHTRGLIVMPLLWRHRAYPLTDTGFAVRAHILAQKEG